MGPTADDPSPPASWPARVATDSALIAVAVPLALGLLVPPDRGGCGNTPEMMALVLGLGSFGLRGIWWFLKLLNEVAEGLLASMTGPPGGIRAASDISDPSREPRTP